MKTLTGSILLVILSILFTSRLTAQAYEPLLSDLNEWHFTTCFNGCGTSTYYTDGDTIHAGLQYKILDGYHYISRTFLLREDVPSRKVYLNKLNPTKDDEYLLYDFSLQVGDSIDMVNPNSPFPTLAGFYKLDSIVLHPLEDGYLYRHFYFSPCISNSTTSGFPVWIEGVGSLSLINAPAGQPNFSGVGELSCYFKNNVSRYANLDSITSCVPSHFLSLSENDLKNDLSIYPNPANTSFQLKGNNNWISFRICDAKGSEIQRQLNTEMSEYFISLDSGVYFLHFLMNNGQILTKKLLIN